VIDLSRVRQTHQEVLSAVKLQRYEQPRLLVSKAPRSIPVHEIWCQSVAGAGLLCAAIVQPKRLVIATLAKDTVGCVTYALKHRSWSIYNHCSPAWMHTKQYHHLGPALHVRPALNQDLQQTPSRNIWTIPLNSPRLPRPPFCGTPVAVRRKAYISVIHVVRTSAQMTLHIVESGHGGRATQHI
jgi:hypothetical protein